MTVAHNRTVLPKPGPVRRGAVLTGDVVGSSRLDPAARRALPGALREASRAARALFGNAIPLEVDVFRGDSWQWVVADAPLGLRAAVFFRAHLRAYASGLDSRVAIGVGPIGFLPRRRVSQGDGPAFRESGRLLEALPRSRRLALAVAGAETPAAIPALVGLIDALIERWTDKQARAVVGELRGWPQARIARLWRPAVRQPVVARHLRQAGWSAVAEGVAWVEEALGGGGGTL